jgi:hypothetical protein
MMACVGFVLTHNMWLTAYVALGTIASGGSRLKL